MATITKKDNVAPNDSSPSWKVASLKQGKKHVIKNLNSLRDVEVKFTNLQNDVDATILVTVFGGPMPPTPAPCKEFTIEVNTDFYPEDTKWSITDTENGLTVKSSPVFTEKFKEYRDEVCLPMGKLKRRIQ
jgi:hypothetical protein